MSHIGLCRFCGKPITWAITTKNRAIPLDPDVNPNGNVAVTEPAPQPGGHYTPRYARVLTTVDDGAGPGEWLTTSHFATCDVYSSRGRRRR